MDLSIKSQEDGVVDVDVKGKITQEQVALATDPLRDLMGPEAYKNKVLLNLQNAEFMDSSGVSWLLISHKRFKENAGRLVLHSVPPVVLNVLKVLRMHLVFEIAPNRDDALRIVEGDML